MTTFDEVFRSAYAFDAPSIEIGHALDGATLRPDLAVRVPLAMLNRHGMIAGSTGTGKTRTLQLLAEGCSRNGIPVFLADVKGDLAGMARPGVANDRVNTRMQQLGRTFAPEAFPVEFLSLTGARGTQLRATVSSFGPILLGKVLDLTDVQQSVLAMVFKYCDDKRMPLLDFDDLRGVLNYLCGEGKQDLKEYGGMSTATVGVLVRKMVELEQQGAAKFFGEPELEIADLMRTVDGRGVVNVLSLADVQDKPRLYSTFLMWLLGQFYYRLPEVGDAPKPKLVFFFDEAHQLFDDASSALVEHIEQVARLIRSKGIGVFFITQTPKDVDEDVLAQLGNRVQHAIRAFTPKDAKNIKAAASTFPANDHVDVVKSITSLGIGEALATVLDPRGVPTAVAPMQVLPPSSLMSAVDDATYAQTIAASPIASKYATPINRESAHEILQRKLGENVEEVEVDESDGFSWRGRGAAAPESDDFAWRSKTPARRKTSAVSRGGRPRKSMAEKVVHAAATQATRSIVREISRGIFGILKR
jgi:uncharacterized protein